MLPKIGGKACHLRLRTLCWLLSPVSPGTPRRDSLGSDSSGSSNLTLRPPVELIEELLFEVPYWYSSQFVGFRAMIARTSTSTVCKAQGLPQIGNPQSSKRIKEKGRGRCSTKRNISEGKVLVLFRAGTGAGVP